ncbi:MAG: hypothetical protein KKC78_15330 [Proteobacteria bacterium]|nr:hypothetical protein [Pseudomonadota bacterium]
MGHPPAGGLARGLAMLLAVGVLALGAMWLAGGARLSPDSYRYLGAAQDINQHRPLVGQKQLAPGYTRPLAWLQRQGLGMAMGVQVVVLVQCLLSLAAAGLAYAALAPLWGRRAALLGGLLYLLLPNLQRWNIYVLSDGPANSMLVMVMAATLMLPRRPWALALLLAAGAWLGLLRSEGFLFLVPPLAYLAWRRRWLPAAALAALVAALVLGQDMGGAAAAQDMLNQARQGVVVWEMSALPPPPELAALPVGNSVQFYWHALTGHPGWLARLMALRGFWLLAYAYPPHHPLWYAVAAPALALALYLLAARGAWRAGERRPESALIWGFLAVSLALAGLTYVASDGRFLTRPLCCLVFLAGVGLQGLLPGGRGAPRLGKR